MQKVRIKKFYQATRINDKIAFIVNPSEGVEMADNEIAYTLMSNLNGEFTLDDVIFNISLELNIDKSVTQKLLEKLFNEGLVEMFSDEDLRKNERYDRQLNYFDAFKRVKQRSELQELQDVLTRSHVLLLGVGGIGSYAAYALAGAGVGMVTLMDGDVIEMSNLNRQILFDEATIGELKVDIAEKKLSSFNSSAKLNKVVQNINNYPELEKSLQALPPIDFIFLSADKPSEIVYWVGEYSKRYAVPFLQTGYMGSYGIIGPLIVPGNRSFEEIYPLTDTEEKTEISEWNRKRFTPPSLACTNGIIANLACLDVIKYLTNISAPNSLDKRIVINLNDLSIHFNHELTIQK